MCHCNTQGGVRVLCNKQEVDVCVSVVNRK